MISGRLYIGGEHPFCLFSLGWHVAFIGKGGHGIRIGIGINHGHFWYIGAEVFLCIALIVSSILGP